MVKAAFVTAAGRGERIRPYSDKTPKPLLPIKGKAILDHVLENLIPLKLDHVVINAWHLKEQIIDHVEKKKSDYPFDIILSKEDELLGTGGGLKKAFPFLEPAPFLMVNGDTFFKGDLVSFVNRGMEREGVSAVWWMFRAQEDQTSIGLHEGRVVEIGSVWKGGDASQRACFAGIQLIKSLNWDDIPDSGCLVRNYWIPRLKKGESIGSDVRDLFTWHDIGTVERYEKLK